MWWLFVGCVTKKKYSEMNERVKNWTCKTYEVIGIEQSGLNGQTTYKLEGLSKCYFRNELLSVEQSKVKNILFFN